MKELFHAPENTCVLFPGAPCPCWQCYLGGPVSKGCLEALFHCDSKQGRTMLSLLIPLSFFQQGKKYRLDLRCWTFPLEREVKVKKMPTVVFKGAKLQASRADLQPYIMHCLPIEACYLWPLSKHHCSTEVCAGQHESYLAQQQQLHSTALSLTEK